MIVIPNLSPDGVITNKRMILVKLYEYFLASDFSQSVIFKDRISSLKYIIQEKRSAEALRTDIVQALTALYLNYFIDVTIDVEINETDNKQELYINVTAIDENNEKYDMNRSLTIIDNNVVDFDTKQEQWYV